MFKYDICILSHPADKAQAERLAASIRAYRLPKKVTPAVADADCRNILLDTDGLPFDGGTQLQQCRQLIVLCSPDSQSFPPVLEKLHYFENNRGRQSIVAVIVRGEPIDAFPSFFIEYKTVQRIQPDGSITQSVETQEPVASDLRADTRKRAKELLKYETVRIVASLLGLEPDALERRHAKRERRRTFTVAALVCAVFLLISVVFAYSSGAARAEGDAAAAMTAMSDAVIARLVDELPRRFEGNAAAEAIVQDTIDEAMELMEPSDADASDLS